MNKKNAVVPTGFTLSLFLYYRIAKLEDRMNSLQQQQAYPCTHTHTGLKKKKKEKLL